VAPDDLEAAIQAAYEERFLHGRPGYADLAHLGLRDFLERLLDGIRQRLGVPDRGESDPFLLAWGEIERQALAVAPGALGVLQTLRDAGLTLGLITNGPSCLQREKLALLDLTPHLDHIVVDTEFGCPKPDPRIFAHAASLAGLAPDQLLFVGDTPAADIAGAAGAGWTAVWIRPPGELFPPGLPAPHHTIGALPELLELRELRATLRPRGG
jgi:putative hydrolase of the HAD superfamily